MVSEVDIRESFAKQAVWCEQLGSPFTARLVAGLGLALDRQTQTGQRILSWAGRPDALGDAVALRLAGALNALVRRGDLPDLARLYPPNLLPMQDDLAAAVMGAIARADAQICQWLNFTPQTNEVARSVALYPGLCVIAQETGLPLSLFEVGASGGLNLMSDQFSYQLGDAATGAAGSPVHLQPDWQGGAAPTVKPEIAGRRGCDQSPLDVRRADHRERLMAYIWPDQEARVVRATAAVKLAQENPPELCAMDAADWVEAQIGEVPEQGVVRVLFHSIAYQYFPQAAQQRIAARMEAAGARATADAPLAWLSFEQYDGRGPRLTLRLWRGNKDDGKERVLATADAHGRAVHWLGGG